MVKKLNSNKSIQFIGKESKISNNTVINFVLWQLHVYIMLYNYFYLLNFLIMEEFSLQGYASNRRAQL